MQTTPAKMAQRTRMPPYRTRISEPFAARPGRKRKFVKKWWRVESFRPFDLSALEVPSTKLSMISCPCPPAPDGLPYVSEWATNRRFETARMQIGIRGLTVGYRAECRNKRVNRSVNNSVITTYIAVQSSGRVGEGSRHTRVRSNRNILQRLRYR